PLGEHGVPERTVLQRRHLRHRRQRAGSAAGAKQSELHAGFLQTERGISGKREEGRKIPPRCIAAGFSFLAWLIEATFGVSRSVARTSRRTLPRYGCRSRRRRHWFP